MARIRTMKPSMWGSFDVSKLSLHSRLLFCGLITMADDDGRFLASSNAILGHVYPNDDRITPAQVQRWLNETARDDEPVHLYEVSGVRYGCMPKWHKHQKINRYTPSILPSPAVFCVPRGGAGEP